ncbi:MAG: sulfotransferase [Caulobacterales bacterium]
MARFDPAQLLAETSQQTGLSDYGPEGFKECLAVYCRALETDVQFDEEGAERQRASIRDLLRRRLELYRDRAKYPEITQQKIKAPLIVIGLPRSGTTVLHALLAQDPAARSPLAWEYGDLSPPPRTETYETDPRIAPAQARADAMPLAFKQMHIAGAQLPEEDNSITTLAFQSANISAGLRMPTYLDWFMNADYTPSYDVMEHVLQHLQAFCPREWWVLKSPGHTLHLDALVKKFPDARLVWPHRDPASSIISNSSLLGFVREMRSGQPVDKHELVEEMLYQWGDALWRALAFRDQPGNEKYFVDVIYDDFVRDPMSQVRKIYSEFGMNLSVAAESAMRTFLENQPKDKHGAHRYTAEDYGLSAKELQKRFKPYIDRFNLRHELQ